MEPRILLTGDIGGRLLDRLERRGESVRCLAQEPAHLVSRCARQTEVVAGDVVSGEGLEPALRGIDTAYYLEHSMGAAEDRTGADHFAAAARAAGLRRSVDLGGLAYEDARLSPRLRSLLDIGKVLRALLGWYGTYPLHALVSRGMVGGIARAASAA